MEDRLVSIEQAIAGIFIQLARIYDVLVASMPEEHREALLKIHSDGALLTELPWLNEDYTSDTIDETEE